ncbi:hypothetical protein Acr_02g0014110 [Actinidia rufa]|uniref:Transmembrane protein n=1 Tax=Actinidia rufa TaxID=165716 RepID=A0A7J0E9J7_9ERIC|nr:hypothetical protein Acr_02g0014110 [Actinidia rufa]
MVSSSISAMEMVKRNLNRGKQTAKTLRRYLPNGIFGVVLILIVFFLVKFGPIFTTVLKFFGPLLGAMALVGLIGLLSYKDQQDQPPRVGEEVYEYIFKPSPEFERAYPNHPYP